MLEKIQLDAIETYNANSKAFTVLRQYARGQHQLQFSSPDFAQKYGEQIKALRLNICEAAYTVFTDRLSVSSWGDDDDTKLLENAGSEKILGLAFDEAFRCGESFILVWPNDNGENVMHLHNAGSIIPIPDIVDKTRLAAAIKPWVDENKYGRLNIYDAEQVARYITRDPLTDKNSELPKDAASWTPYETDEEPHIITHDYAAVPVCWITAGAETLGGNGRSILADVIPVQDAINKLFADFIIVSEAYSRPFRYILNYRPKESNPLAAAADYSHMLAQVALSQVSKKFNPNKQQFFAHDGGGPIGQLDAPNITSLTDAQNYLVSQVPNIIGVPPFLFSAMVGEPPSGISLRTLSQRMIARVGRFQRDSSPVLRGLAQLMGIPEPVIKWANPMPLDPSEKWQIANSMKAVGIALADILVMLEIDDAEAIAERASEHEAKVLEAGRKQLRDGLIDY